MPASRRVAQKQKVGEQVKNKRCTALGEKNEPCNKKTMHPRVLKSQRYRFAIGWNGEVK